MCARDATHPDTTHTHTAHELSACNISATLKNTQNQTLITTLPLEKKTEETQILTFIRFRVCACARFLQF